MENSVKEFWYFVRSEVKKLTSVEPSERQKYADALLQDLGHQERCACELSLQCNYSSEFNSPSQKFSHTLSRNVSTLSLLLSTLWMHIKDMKKL